MDSVHLLTKIKYHSIFVDESHHPLPSKMPRSMELYRLSATHKEEPDFRYTMGQAIEDGILCDYDITVPALTAHHAYVCLGDLLLKQVGRFRRVLAYCNSIAEAKRFRMVLRELGLEAWHINGKTPLKKRQTAIAEFAGPLLKPVHVLVTVEVLGEGINIPNADTCMFVEPRKSYSSIIQAIGRVLRHHPAKTLAHIVLPAVAIPSSRAASVSLSACRNEGTESHEQQNAKEFRGLCNQKPRMHGQTPQESKLPTSQIERRKDTRNKQPFSMAGDEEVAPRSKSPAAATMTAPCVAASKTGVHPATTSDQVPTNPEWDFEATPHDNGEPEGQVGPTATRDRQQDGLQQEHPQKTSGSIRKSHWQSAQMPEEELQNQHLERFIKAGTFDPSMGPEPNKQKARGTAYTKRAKTFKLKASGGSPMFNQRFDSQLEHFLATLIIADHRLVGATAQHRIQVADCTLADAGAITMEGWTAEIYSRLSVILFGDDRWESRLKELEMFANKHQRLPLRKRDSHYERTLGTWLDSQCTAFRNQRLPLHRFQKLLSASSPLLRRRVEGWQAGDTDGRFRRRCHELREYVQLHQTLPKKTPYEIASPSGKLGQWLEHVRGGAIALSLNKRKMLQETHPLVKAALQKWKDAPRVQRFAWDQKFNELSMLVTSLGRIPKYRGGDKVERRCYHWLRAQCRRVLSGYLPDDMTQRLWNAHPLIAAYVETYVQEAQCKFTNAAEPGCEHIHAARVAGWDFNCEANPLIIDEW